MPSSQRIDIYPISYNINFHNKSLRAVLYVLKTYSFANAYSSRISFLLRKTNLNAYYVLKSTNTRDVKHTKK